MKRLCIVFLIFMGHVLCQEYINVHTDAGIKHDLLESIDKITFGNSEINFELKNGFIATEDLNDILRITFGGRLGDLPLPVDLVTFSAEQNGKEVNLFWETAAEVNNQGFQVERTYKGSSQWKKLGFVQGNGSTSSSSSYSYCDNEVTEFYNIRYRLKQIDFDGSFEYSEIISVTLNDIIQPIVYALNNNYPNPFNPETTISYQIIKENITTLIIYDMLGHKIKKLVDKNQSPGKYKIKFNGANLSSGVYFCKLNSGNYTKMIKMLLVK